MTLCARDIGSVIGSGTEASVIGSGTEASVIGSGTEASMIGSGTEASVIGSGTEASVIGSGTEASVIGSGTDSSVHVCTWEMSKRVAKQYKCLSHTGMEEGGSVLNVTVCIYSALGWWDAC